MNKVATSLIAIGLLIGCAIGTALVYKPPENPPDTDSYPESILKWFDEWENYSTWEYDGYAVSVFENGSFLDSLNLLQYSLSTQYTVFDASVQYRGNTFFGLGYSDFSLTYDCGEGNYLVGAGFVSTSGPIEIDLVSEDSIIITPLSDELDFGYVWTERIGAFKEHCVYEGRYITYGVDNLNEFNYTVYSLNHSPEDPLYLSELKSIFDTSLGDLYSYDEGRWLYRTDYNTTPGICSTYIQKSIDYDTIVTELNEIIQNQDLNFSSSTVETYVHYAIETQMAFLLSLQEETFLGVNTKDLIAAAENLDVREYFEITPDGVIVSELPPPPPPEPSLLAKWLTGICAAIVCITATAVTVLCPASAVAMGALIGAAVEVFTQVVIENTDWSQLNLGHILVGAVAGGIAAIPGVGLVMDAVIGGVANSVMTVIDGGDTADILTAFAFGTTAGLALGGVFKAGANALKKIVTPSKTKVVLKRTIQINGKFVDPGDLSINIQLFAKKTAKQIGKDVDPPINSKVPVKKASDNINTLSLRGANNRVLQNFKDVPGFDKIKADLGDDFKIEEMALLRLDEFHPNEGYVLKSEKEIFGKKFDHISLYVNKLKVKGKEELNSLAYHLHFRPDGEIFDSTSIMVTKYLKEVKGETRETGFMLDIVKDPASNVKKCMLSNGTIGEFHTAKHANLKFMKNLNDQEISEMLSLDADGIVRYLQEKSIQVTFKNGAGKNIPKTFQDPYVERAWVPDESGLSGSWKNIEKIIDTGNNHSSMLSTLTKSMYANFRKTLKSPPQISIIL